ncbi:hypothetical protein F4810DRAFT_722761 [Camillea tinctor]|nr:hypothetical protein F4810DRAFT_722761 [Camillea tinctor]
MSQSTKHNEPIAIVGSGCRFPGSASSPSKLWDLLASPRDVLSQIPPTRFDPHGFYHPDAEYNGHSNVLHSYVLDEDHRAWDAEFFGVSVQEATAIDPQQRLLMECVYEALENGGQRIHDLRGSNTAVYVGLMCEEYSDIQGRELNTIPRYFPTGTARSIVSNRISYFFDWRGASMTIDTACSSSLVAVHQAAQVLRSGASRVAIAAGTNLLLGPEPYIAESTFHMLSPRGRSDMWDAGADGYGRGDGVAAVVLKRLSDAVADGDSIACIIRETGVNQDGRTNGITVPSADSQVSLIEDTYRRAGLNLAVEADQPQFFEAHGTGTLAGDPIEAEAIYRAIGRHMSNECNGAINSKKLFVGSIKSVIGHTEGTAGLAGLLKASLAIQNGLVPPNLHFNRLNPAIEPFYKGLEVLTSGTPWKTAGNQPLRASVNSFGFGGTNAHAILESYKPKSKVLIDRVQTHSSCMVPYTFSAATKASLKSMLQDFTAFLQENPAVNAHDLAYTLNVRRSILPFRVAYTGRSVSALKENIDAAISTPNWESDGGVVRAPSSKPTHILGIFTGQGAQWSGMGKQLFEDLPFASARLWELEMALATLPPADRPVWSLTAELLEADEAKSKLHLAEYAQPLCTALQIVLVDLLAAAGVHFNAVVGHSSGEIAAAYAAGVLSARDAIVIAYYRGVYSALAGTASGLKGAMMAVGTTFDDAEEITSLPQFEGRLSVAAHNSPTSVTLSGDEDAIQEAEVMFQDEGKFARLLRVDKAYHSHHMQPCTARYVDALRRASVQASAPRKDCKWHSSVFKDSTISGNSKEELNGMYWALNMAQTVLFSSAVENAINSTDSPFTMAVEVGPHGALRGPFKDIVTAMDKTVPSQISCLSRGSHSSDTFGKALGQIWAFSSEGSVDLDNFQIATHGISGHSRNFMSNLPKYPWDNRRIFWHESRRSRALRARSEPGHPLLGTVTPDSTGTDLIWHNVLRVSDLPWLAGHQLQGETVFPAAGYVALAVEAAMLITKAASASAQRIELKDVTIGNAIVFDNENMGIETIFSMHIEDKVGSDNTIAASFRFRSAVGERVDTILNVSGRVVVTLLQEDDNETEPGVELLCTSEDEPSLMVDVDDEDFYSALRELGYQYSMSFRALSGLKRKLGHGRARLAKPSPPDMHRSEKELLVHPGLLDAAFQGIFLAYSWPGDGRLWSLHVPVSIQSIQFDVERCRSNTDGHLTVNSTIVMDGSVTGQAGITGDVSIFTQDRKHGVIQVEGIRIIPFAAASESQDTPMFFTHVSGVAFPDGELAMRGDQYRAPIEEIELGWLLERISHFYLKRLVNEITTAEEAQAEWHHRKLMDFARHVEESVRTGSQPYGKKEWVHDTAEILEEVMDAHDDKIEVRLMRSVGEHLAEAVRGETVILEHMLKDGMLNQYYVESLGLKPYTSFMAEIIGQITHVNPRLRVLEIGAGTGGATKSILQRIGDAFDHYTFTDISSGFFDTAKTVFPKHFSSGRMSFEVLDAEKDIVAQGFKEQSYDLLIASLVLHATKDLEHTLRNIRRLLRPGGFLVMIEVTSNVTMRLSFTMGGLEGWWLGAETGRPWTPCVSAAEWHDLLLQSGFSGVESSTLELDTLPRPFGVLVSRAVDDRIQTLISPSLEVSPFSTIPELVIVTGGSLRTVRLAQAAARILRPHCKSIKTITGVAQASSSLTGGSTRLTVLYLGDLDRPVFEELSPANFDGLKILLEHTQNLLWVTSGARCERPHSNMSLGLCRAMLMEQKNMRIQFIDFAAGILPDAHIVVDDLLRLSILRGMEQGTPEDEDYLWAREPEIVVDANGRRWVSRIMSHSKFNNAYNSSRRKIVTDAYPDKEIIEIHEDNEGHGNRSLIRTEITGNCGNNDDAGLLRIRSLYSAALPLKLASSQTFYASIGTCLASGNTFIALSDRLGSIANVKKSYTIPYTHPIEEAPARLRVIAHNLLAAIICNEAREGDISLLVEPPEDLAVAVTGLAKSRGLKITCVTTSLKKRAAPFTFIHPHANNDIIRKRLVSPPSEIIVFSEPETKSHVLVRRLQAWLPRISTRTIDSLQFRGRSGVSPVTSLSEAAESIVPGDLKACDVVSAKEYTSAKQVRSTAIIDWTQDTKFPLAAVPSDALPLLRNDRTYLLFGLAGKGGLGLSLAEYFVRQGARHIILTSRSPTVDNKLISTYAEQGVRIQVLANDVTDESALRKLVADVRTSGSWPPIAGVANGAMVLNDITLQNMSYDQMTRVLKPKVEGTRILDQIFHSDELDFFVLFSSLSCVFGREGQANYDAANMYLVGLAAQRRARGLSASVIDIGAIMGTGYMAREVSERTLAQLLGAGYRKMSERDFHIAFANGIIAGRSQSESAELITGLYVPGPGEDFTPAWAHNPRFSHVLLRTGTALDKSIDASSKVEPTADLLKRAKTRKDVTRVIQFVVLNKIGTMLQLGTEAASDHASLLQQHTSSLGVDSLIAVEIRSWMMHELDVDIPVLKILSDVTIQDIVDFASENLSEELTPNIDPNAEDAISLDELTKPVNNEPKTMPTPSVPQEIDTIISEIPEPPTAIGTETKSDSSSTTSSSNDIAEEASSQLTPSSVSSSNSEIGPTCIPEKLMPMSYGQSRFWLMSQIVEDPCAFNVTCDIEINAELDIPTLSRAVQSLGARHEALRTCFFTDVQHGHQPVQGIFEESTLRLETISAKAFEVAQLFEEMHKTVYDLEKGDLMRILLVSTSPTKHHLLVGYHHINMDSSSLAILVYDLQRLYSGKRLPPPRVQYPDFASHQLERLRNGYWEKQISFWRTELSSPPSPIPILDISPSANRPRPERIAYQIHSKKTRVTARVASQVQALCRKARVTPFHLYTTILQVLIARLANVDDFCIGMADANRSEMGATDSIGNFLNLLPIRLKSDMNKPFESIMKTTRERILNVMSNSVIPFDIILEQVQPQRSATHSPLFQVFIDYRQVTEKLPWGKGTLEGKQYLLSKTPYDVMIDIIDTPTGEASLEMMVQGVLYTADDAAKLLGCYVNMLSAFTENSFLVANEVSMFNRHEVQAALRIGHGKSYTVLPKIDETAASQPSSAALEDTAGNTLSWSEMVARSKALAQALAMLDMPAHSRVGVLQEPAVDWIYSMLGIWRSGNTYVPLDISQGIQRLGDISRAAQLAAVVIHDMTSPLVSKLGLPGSVTVLNVSNLLPGKEQEMSNLPLINQDDEAMVMYTSGSTGTPKGISIPHRVVVNAMQSMLLQWPMGPQTVLQQIAISFDLSWWGALLGLMTRGKVIVAGREARRDPRALTNLITTKGVTLTVAVPTEAAAWLEHGNLAALRSSKWAWYMAAGEPFSFGLIRQLQTLNKRSLRVINAYGPTETMIPTTYEIPYQTTSVSDMPVPIGSVIANYTARVVNAQGQAVPAGVPGHLVFGGAGIAHGYIGNPELTAEKFPDDSLAGPVALGQKWTRVHMTGDRGYLRESDGVFMLMGRMDGDTQVKLRGLRIDLLDIEQNIVSTAKGQITGAAVHVRKPTDNDPSSHFLAAYAVLAQSSRSRYQTEVERTAFLRQVGKDLPLPDYMRPTSIFAVDALPFTHHGKLDRKVMVTWPLRDTVSTSTVHTQTDGSASMAAATAGKTNQRKMKDLWLDILGNTGRSHDLNHASDFFSVGGNSLLLIRLQGELRRLHGMDVPLVELFQRSTLAQMASLLDGVDSSAPKLDVDWANETKLQSDLVHLRAKASPQSTNNHNLVVALTGASGFLGRETLKYLVARPEIKTVYCLAVRNPSTLADISSPKIVIYPGDLSLPDLGLDQDAIREVFSSADVIIHNGADTSFLKAYNTVRATNLGSTKVIVRHALRHSHVRSLHFVSTAGISTMMGRDLYEESLAALPPQSATEGYVLSKWASELYLENASAATALPVTIHRPTSIVGAGAPLLDVMSNVLRFSEALRTVPSMSALEGTFQFVDVADVAADIVASVLSRGDAAKISSDGKNNPTLVQYRNHSGEPRDAINVHEFGEYLGRKLGTSALPVLPDEAWIAKAEASGMAPEVARYLQGMNLHDRKGLKWTFPMVWKGRRV